MTMIRLEYCVITACLFLCVNARLYGPDTIDIPVRDVSEFWPQTEATTPQRYSQVFGDYIDIVFDDNMPEEYKPLFETAAQIWGNVIANTLPPVTIDVPASIQALCGGATDNTHIFIPQTLEKLTLFAEVVNIDGSGNVLALATPCITVSDIPIIG